MQQRHYGAFGSRGRCSSKYERRWYGRGNRAYGLPSPTQRGNCNGYDHREVQSAYRRELLNSHSPPRLSFELTLDEAVELMEFIKVYQAAIAAAQRKTEPGIESVIVDEEFSSDTDGDKVL